VEKDTLLILGSARSHGETRMMVDFLLKKMPSAELMNLKEFDFSGYDYDRWSDLVTIRKEKGRGLAGKKMFALCCSSDGEEHEGFFMPFEKTAGYLKMFYGGDVHTWLEENKIPAEVENRLLDFCKKITA